MRQPFDIDRLVQRVRNAPPKRLTRLTRKQRVRLLLLMRALESVRPGCVCGLTFPG